jgi:hypothetical protein
MAVTERRTQIYLTEDQHEKVTRVARERGMSLAAVVREALDRYVAAGGGRSAAPWAQDPALALLGSLELPPLAGDGDADLVEAIDRSVYEQD